jgi:threonine aldolase
VGAARLIAPVEANDVFLHLTESASVALTRAGIRVQPREGGAARMVCRAEMAEADIDRCITLAAGAALR